MAVVSNMKKIFGLGVSLCLLVSAFDASALFRYKDDNGRTVMSATVPPEIVPKGYEVLNAQGRVVEVVPPALTAEQIKERDALAEQKRIEEEARLAQQKEDDMLLKQFGTPSSAVTLLKRRLNEIDAVITSQKGVIENAKKAVAENEEKAANLQRNGRPVPANITKNIAKAQAEEQRAVGVIKGRSEAREKLIAEFKVKIDRLVKLTGKEAPSY